MAVVVQLVLKLITLKMLKTNNKYHTGRRRSQRPPMMTMSKNSTNCWIKTMMMLKRRIPLLEVKSLPRGMPLRVKLSRTEFRSPLTERRILMMMARTIMKTIMRTT